MNSKSFMQQNDNCRMIIKYTKTFATDAIVLPSDQPICQQYLQSYSPEKDMKDFEGFSCHNLQPVITPLITMSRNISLKQIVKYIKQLKVELCTKTKKIYEKST